MPKGDIDEVEREIRAVKAPLAIHYNRTSRKAVAAAVEELEKAERDGIDTEKAALKVAAILLLIRSQLRSPLSRQKKAAFVASAKRLILSGIRSSGGAGGKLKARGATIAKQARKAGRELATLSAQRIEAKRTAKRIDALLTEFQESTKARRTPKERKKEEKDAEAKGNKPPRIAKRKDGSKGSPDRVQWKKDLKKVLDDKTGSTTNVIADAWAYRQHNVGVFMAAKASRIDTLVAINPKDDKTTKFCNWVHGKVISIRRIEGQLDDYQKAISDDDKKAAEKEWPFIDQSAKGLKKARARLRQGRTGKNRRIQDTEVYRRYFVRVGLPPYHFRCRTVARPRSFLAQ